MAEKKKKVDRAPAVEVRSNGASTLDVAALREIIDILEASDVTRLVWRNGREKLFIRRGPAVTHMMPAMMTSAPAVHVTSGPSALEKPRASSPARTAAPAEAAAEKKGQLITSPFVGTFYRTPAPDQPAFVEVGA